MKNLQKTYILFFLLLLTPIDVILGAGPPPPPPNPGCWPPPCIPIDGGVCFLIFAGLALGAFKIYTSFKRKAL